MTRWGMVIDLGKCVGCQTCTVACKWYNYTPRGIFFCKTIDYEMGEYPNVTRRFLPVLCMHCEAPPCEKACPTKATIKGVDGIVYVDYDKCVGCRYCMMACPYQARSYHKKEQKYYEGESVPHDAQIAQKFQKGVVMKCDFCRERVEEGIGRGLRPGVDLDATPTYVISCITNARHFGDLDDPQSSVSKLIRDRKGYQLHQELETRPGVYYIQ